jgi:hypothetical protein
MGVARSIVIRMPCCFTASGYQYIGLRPRRRRRATDRPCGRRFSAAAALSMIGANQQDILADASSARALATPRPASAIATSSGRGPLRTRASEASAVARDAVRKLISFYTSPLVATRSAMMFYFEFYGRNDGDEHSCGDQVTVAAQSLSAAILEALRLSHDGRYSALAGAFKIYDLACALVFRSEPDRRPN